MYKLRLVLPTPNYKDQILEYKEEFINNNEYMHGTADLDSYKTFEDWYINVCNAIRGQNIKEGKVPATTYLVITEDENKLIGMVDIRHRLNTFLANYGGHIGYSVRASERNKGYGKQILKETLKICKDMRLDNVLVTCLKGNIASEKVIKANGGYFDKEVPYQNTFVKHYWINVNKSLNNKKP